MYVIQREDFIGNEAEYSGFNLGDNKYIQIEFKLAKLYKRDIKLDGFIKVYELLLGDIPRLYRVISITPNNDYSFTVRAIEIEKH